MKILLQDSKIRFFTLLGLLSGLLGCFFLNSLLFFELFRIGINLGDVKAILLFSVIFSLFYFCPVFTGLGMLSGLVVTSTIENKYKYLILLCESFLCGFWVFLPFNPIHIGESIIIEALKLSITLVAGFMSIFLWIFFPFFYIFIKKGTKQ